MFNSNVKSALAKSKHSHLKCLSFLPCPNKIHEWIHKFQKGSISASLTCIFNYHQDTHKPTQSECKFYELKWVGSCKKLLRCDSPSPNKIHTSVLKATEMSATMAGTTCAWTQCLGSKGVKLRFSFCDYILPNLTLNATVEWSMPFNIQ